MKTLRIMGFIAFLALCSCAVENAQTAATPNTAAPSQKELDDAFEALLRFRFADNPSGMKQKAAAYFVRIMGKDPSDAFLARFDGNAPPVKKVSECRRDGMGSVIDVITGKSGLLFDIVSCKTYGKGGFRVICGYEESKMSGDQGAFILEKGNNGWQVQFSMDEYIIR